MKYLKSADLVLLGILFILAISMLFFLRQNSGELVAIIYKDGCVIEEINLSHVTTPYQLDIGETILSVEPGRICFAQAQCEDRLCIRHGWLEKSGETMACVPAKTVISLKSEKNTPDAITG